MHWQPARERSVLTLGVKRLLHNPEAYAFSQGHYFRWVEASSSGVQLLTDSMQKQLAEAAEQQAAERIIPGDVRLGDYMSLAELRQGGFAQRYLQTLARTVAGIDVSLPYLDRTVVAACLGLPAYLRRPAGEFKPIVPAAFPELLPPILTKRTTKGTYNPAMFKGLRAQLPLIRSLFDEDCCLSS